MTPWITIFAVAAAGFVAWILYRRFGGDRIEGFNEKRRASSRLVGKGQLVDGNRHVEVALALTNSTFFYENADMQASVDLQWVREIEYDTELVTGSIPPQGKVLRLRTQSQTFEFVLPNDVVARWHMMLPPRRTVVAASSPAVLAPAVSAT